MASLMSFLSQKIELNDSILRLYYLNGSSFIVKQYTEAEAYTIFNEFLKEKSANRNTITVKTILPLYTEPEADTIFNEFFKE